MICSSELVQILNFVAIVQLSFREQIIAKGSGSMAIGQEVENIWAQLRRLRQYCNFGRKQRNIQFCSELHVTSWGFRQPLLRAKETTRRLDTSWRISEIGYGILVFRLLDAWNPGSWFLIRSDSFEKNCKLKTKEHCQEKFGVSLESLTSEKCL